MQIKIHRLALPLVLALAGLAFASGAGAANRGWGGSPRASLGDPVTIQQPTDVELLSGDPDVPNLQKRLGTSNGSDVALPAGTIGKRTGLEFGRVWMRLLLSSWLAR